jgi:adenylate kinase family enzyme
LPARAFRESWNPLQRPGTDSIGDAASHLVKAKRIHILGASGAGTSTLGRELARRFDLSLFDVDHFFWEPTDPPYQHKRERAARQALLAEALVGADRWVLAGSLCGWGDGVIHLFDLVVFVVTASDVRLARLRERERRRFGDRVAPAGDMHEQHRAFMEWAAQYDEGSMQMRSRGLHEDWLARLTCPLLRVDGARSLEELCDEVAAAATGD